MRIAAIADVHGNLLALEAVLADIAGRGVDRIINLGDCVSGPLWPRECLEVLSRPGLVTVRGNHDRWVGQAEAGAMGASDRFAAAQLDGGQRGWLAALPPLVVMDVPGGLVAFHARPDDDNRYLVEDVVDGRLVRAAAREVASRLGATEGRVVLCAHSHLPHLVRLGDGRLVVNPGSVGCPAYEDPEGVQHVSEAGSPHARYAILDLGGEQGDGVAVAHLAVAYDWEAAARRAERVGRPGWAHALRTGFMPEVSLGG